jgi:excisionase family DNA binding protein
MTEKLWNVEDMAARYGTTRRTIAAWVRLHHVPFVRVGKRMIRFDPETIRNWERDRANLGVGKEVQA